MRAFSTGHPDVNKERRGSTPARFTRVRLAHLLVVGLLLGLNGWQAGPVKA